MSQSRQFETKKTLEERSPLVEACLQEKTKAQKAQTKANKLAKALLQIKGFRRCLGTLVGKELIIENPEAQRMLKKADQLGDALLNKRKEAQKQLEKVDFSSEAR